MKLMLKFIIIFWVIVISVAIIRFLAVNIPKDMNFNFTSKETDGDHIYFPLEKRLAFVLNGLEGCIKENRSFPELYKNEILNTGSSCWNSECEITVEFGETVPETIELFVKKEGKCEREEFKVPKLLDTIGYRVDIKLTKEQRLNLGVGTVDKLRLKQANGYSITPKHKYFFYDKKLEKDIILLDDEELDTVYFKKQH